jgi:hypothetical protein
MKITSRTIKGGAIALTCFALLASVTSVRMTGVTRFVLVQFHGSCEPPVAGGTRSWKGHDRGRSGQLAPPFANRLARLPLRRHCHRPQGGCKVSVFATVSFPIESRAIPPGTARWRVDRRKAWNHPVVGEKQANDRN